MQNSFPLNIFYIKTLIIEKLPEKQHKKGVLLLQYAMKCEIKKQHQLYQRIMIKCKLNGWFQVVTRTNTLNGLYINLFHSKF